MYVSRYKHQFCLHGFLFRAENTVRSDNATCLPIKITHSSSGQSKARYICLYWCDVNPEPGIIGPVFAVRVDLSLNPPNSRFVSVDVVCVRIAQAGDPIAVSCHPPVVTIVALTVPARGYIRINI
jgi:hypothetical protein